MPIFFKVNLLTVAEAAITDADPQFYQYPSLHLSALLLGLHHVDTETTDVQSTQVVSHPVAILTDVLLILAKDAALELIPGVVSIHTLTIPLDGVALVGAIPGVAAAGAIPGEAVAAGEVIAAAGVVIAAARVRVAVVDTTMTIVTITTNAVKVAKTEIIIKYYKCKHQIIYKLRTNLICL